MAGASAHQRRLVPVPAAHDLEVEAGAGGRLAAGHCPQRVAAVYGRPRIGRERDTALDCRERASRFRCSYSWRAPTIIQANSSSTELAITQYGGRDRKGQVGDVQEGVVSWGYGTRAGCIWHSGGCDRYVSSSATS